MTLSELPRFDEVIDSLEPQNVGSYVVAVGHAFDGINLFGPFESLEEALDWRSNTGLDEDSPFDDGPAHVIPVYTNYPA